MFSQTFSQNNLSNLVSLSSANPSELSGHVRYEVPWTSQLNKGWLVPARTSRRTSDPRYCVALRLKYQAPQSSNLRPTANRSLSPRGFGRLNPDGDWSSSLILRAACMWSKPSYPEGATMEASGWTSVWEAIPTAKDLSALCKATEGGIVRSLPSGAGLSLVPLPHDQTFASHSLSPIFGACQSGILWIHYEMQHENCIICHHHYHGNWLL